MNSSALLVGSSSEPVSGRAGCLAVPVAVRSEDKAPPTGSPPVEFDRYTLVILRTDKDWPKDKATREALFRQHQGHLQAMARAGKLVVAGPLGDQDDKTARGIGLWRTSLEETRRLSSEDPAVKSGVFLLLDSQLGEYDVETKLGEIQILDGKTAPKEARPFSELAALVDKKP